MSQKQKIVVGSLVKFHSDINHFVYHVSSKDWIHMYDSASDINQMIRIDFIGLIINVDRFHRGELYTAFDHKMLKFYKFRKRHLKLIT